MYFIQLIELKTQVTVAYRDKDPGKFTFRRLRFAGLKNTSVDPDDLGEFTFIDVLPDGSTHYPADAVNFHCFLFDGERLGNDGVIYYGTPMESDVLIGKRDADLLKSL